MKKDNNKEGFTLIELLIVIAVMAILTTVVFVALNPLARFQDSRNSRRWSDVNAILGAIKLNQVDNGGAYLPSVTTNGFLDGVGNQNNFLISTKDDNALATGVTCNGGTLAGVVDLKELVDKGYLPKMPFDPNDIQVVQADGDVDKSMYYLRVEANSAVTVGACSSEKGSAATAPIVEVTR
ncbi:type II secretion system GspH family protein [Candidatus Parcubacteria bacterium]|nr:type II secretion system GspH family protein [Patescibacteria group bacterium]MBU4309427.1 type II secretion system GspH family protein [Patescibacteria group bacterium]MBU4432736.1 type II secretion system GspH family protein [Patescibacteria group bacterium]MBU4577788.1 type II secretion system GspH family protein [Patescibacteria group bacterium]MCG2696781.1 type II secretion system GspH family protein [Candidatus Parcubacteria bacterium]